MGEWRSGPIAITGASGQVGQLLQRRLAELPNAARRLNQGDDWGQGMRGAVAVAHLAGTLQPKGANSYEKANVGTTKAAVSAARKAGAERIVFLSYHGADPGSANEYLRSKAQAEDLVASSGIPATIFRCVHIYGPPERPGPTATAFLAGGRRRVVVPGSGKQRIAPLFIGDVVEAVLRAALDPDAPTGTFELAGPERMSMDEFVRRLNGGEVRIRHLPGRIAMAIARFSPALTPALMDLLVRDNVPSSDPARVAAEFGFSLHDLEAAWGAQSS